MPDRQDITKATRKYRTRNEGDFPEEMFLTLKKQWDLKYGENPNQHAAIYSINWINYQNTAPLAELTNIQSVRSDSKGKGGLSLNNTMDICRGIDTLKYFHNSQAVAIMKHTIVSGFARSTQYNEHDQLTIFRLARDADLLSNFGGTAIFTNLLEMQTAEAMYELKGESPFFVDVVAAPDYDKGVLKYLEHKSKNLRIAKFSYLDQLPKFTKDKTKGLISIKEMPGGLIGTQDLYLTSIQTADDLILRPYLIKDNKEISIELKPTQKELEDMLTAWWLNISGTRSNGIVFIRDGISVAIGSGKVARVTAVKDAIETGMQKAMDREGITYDPLMGINNWEKLKDNPFNGAVASSDAFFPFPDSVELMKRVGVSGVVQPYGSNMDAEIIEKANKLNITMPATLERCFGHF
jgi:phosphoribosylaminoimidazolecarboxamide formyltransferase / IMP cyclohydrolase